jgi:hypothetical protein
MSIEAMKQALDAMQFALHVGFDESSESQIKKGGKAGQQHRAAITALRTAIEQSEKQDPVDLESPLESLVNLCNSSPLYCNTDEVIKAEAALERLYKLRATSSKREWVGLTEEEMLGLIPEADGSAEADAKRVEVLPGVWGKEYEEVDAWSKPLVLQMFRDHENKLKEKNT